MENTRTMVKDWSISVQMTSSVWNVKMCFEISDICINMTIENYIQVIVYINMTIENYIRVIVYINMTIENVHPGYSVYKQCRIKLLSQAVYYYGSCRQSTTTEPAGSLLLRSLQAVYYYGSCRQSITTDPTGSLLLRILQAVYYCGSCIF